MTALEVVVLFAAAFVAGCVNAIAGGGTLISFPMLVWIGRDPIVANATNTASLWPGSLAALFGFRGHLREVRHWMPYLAVPSVVGAMLGAVLLLWTPSAWFARIVPWLILFATELFAAQVPLTRAMRHRARAPIASWTSGVVLFQLAVAIYGGYFGAGIGILMLASLGLSGFSDIHEMMALRNFAAVWINLVAAAYFAVKGAVYWPDAIVMIVAQIAGSYSAAILARRLGRHLIRRAVVVIGLAMGLSLLISSASTNSRHARVAPA